MKLYRLEIYDFGVYGERGLKRVGTGLTCHARTSKAEALKLYNDERRRLGAGNHRFHMTLEHVEMPSMCTDLWIHYIEKEWIPVVVLDLLRDVRGEPSTDVAA